ncbi:MAG: NAD(P)H-quinone oxidoreductase [Chloroflexota bacterium]
MKGIVVKNESEVPTLSWQDVEDVTFGPDEVLVKVRATAVNRADLMQASGNYPPPPGASPILGLEMAGEIWALGDEVEGWEIGDRVCALLPGGGYAEQVAVPAEMLMKLPDVWTFEMGTAVPEVWLTAYVNLFLEADLQAGEIALIHAGASGVGTAAIQLARAVDAVPFITAGSETKLARCRELGAELAINYKTDDFLTLVKGATDGIGVDVILDPVGGSYLERNIKALSRFGRLVNIGLLGGVNGEINMALLLINRLKIVGSTLRSRPPAEKISITKKFESGFWPLLKEGTLKPIVDSTFSIRNAQEAHQYVRENKNVGKVILRVD